MYKLLIVTADTNDADYVTKETEITEEDILKLNNLLPLLRKTGPNFITYYCPERYKSPELMYKGILTSEDIEYLDNFIPYGENGIHTVTSVKVLTVIETQQLL